MIGAREFLIAYNINFNTRDAALVNDIALEIREKGRVKKDAKGAIVKDDRGEKVWVPGPVQGRQGDRLVHRAVRLVPSYPSISTTIRFPSTRCSWRFAARPRRAASGLPAANWWALAPRAGCRRGVLP